MSEVRLTYKAAGGGGFRSELEAKVAAELDRHGVVWRYEEPVTLADGQTPHYLPDFTIDSAPDELQLPRWIEVKPAEHLYDLRTAVGIDARFGQYFDDDIVMEGLDHVNLRSIGIERIWKPKLLAELSGQSVLVVSKAGAVRHLSVEMRPDAVVFSRRHPFVNAVGIQQERERERRREEWRAAEAERMLIIERERAQLVARVLSAGRRYGTNGYGQSCLGCHQYVPANDGHLYWVTINNGGRYVVICGECDSGGGRAA